MTNQARVAVFKSQAVALIEQLHFTPSEVVGLGLSLAASYALPAGISRDAVRRALDESLDAAEAKAPGIVEVGGGR